MRAGWDIGLCVDGWKAACEAHLRWRPELPVTEARCEVAHLLDPGPFRYVWASPSCKPWSTANRTPKRGLRHDEYYPLTLLVEQAFDAWRARWLVIENVGGLVWSREGREEVERLRLAVAKRGLRLSLPPRGTIASNTLGVAQLRRRVFLIVGPDFVSIRPGGGWIPPAGVEPILWEAEERASTAAILGDDHPAKWKADYRSPRASRGVVDASGPSRHANWTGARAGRGVTATGEGDSTSQDPRSREVNNTGRTLAECCELQQIPPFVVAGLTKRVAHALVGNAVPASCSQHIGRLVLEADAKARAA